METFPIKLPSRGVVEASAVPSVVQQPEAAAPALRVSIPALICARIVEVTPYIDLVDGHGHIVVAHGVTVYDVGRTVYTSPLVTLICGICDDAVVGDGETVEVTGTVTWCRVNGNSRYGYEPYHQLCLDLVR